MGTTITITTPTDTLVITGEGVYDGPTYDKLDGWYEVDADLRFEKRPSAPGAFAPARTYANERPVSVEGQYFGSDRADALTMRERLTGLYSDGAPVTMTVADDLRTTSREVHVESVKIRWTVRQEFAFTIDAEAADPRRYAPAGSDSTGLAQPGEGLATPLVFPLDFGDAATDGRVLTVNDGNAATVSTFTVSGGEILDGFVLVNVTTGQRIAYVGPLAADTTVVIDMALRTAFINGTAPAGRYLSAPEWWQVPPRSSVEVQLLARGPVTAGSPTLIAETASAYY